MSDSNALEALNEPWITYTVNEKGATLKIEGNNPKSIADILEQANELGLVPAKLLSPAEMAKEYGNR